jgi:ribosome-associated translation inhibitor RaiA
MNNIHFEFKKITPDNELQDYARKNMTRVMALAPLGASCVAVLSKDNKVYRCSLDICSFSGPLLVRAESSSSKGAIEFAIKKAEGKLLKWQERKLEKVRDSARAMFSFNGDSPQRAVSIIAGTA